MPANEREVYGYLTADESTPIEIDMLTFAVFADELKAWIKLREQRKGEPPSQAEIDDWISNLTDLRFAQMRQQAIQFFDTAARRYLAEEIEEGRQEALRSALVREVRAAGGVLEAIVYRSRDGDFGPCYHRRHSRLHARLRTPGANSGRFHAVVTAPIPCPDRSVTGCRTTGTASRSALVGTGSSGVRTGLCAWPTGTRIA
jgi:hypothetical protein